MVGTRYVSVGLERGFMNNAYIIRRWGLTIGGFEVPYKILQQTCLAWSIRNVSDYR